LKLVDGRILHIGKFFKASVSWKHLGGE
jgi:hypothetical protein